MNHGERARPWSRRIHTAIARAFCDLVAPVRPPVHLPRALHRASRSLCGLRGPRVLDVRRMTCGGCARVYRARREWADAVDAASSDAR